MAHLPQWDMKKNTIRSSKAEYYSELGMQNIKKVFIINDIMKTMKTWIFSRLQGKDC